MGIEEKENKMRVKKRRVKERRDEEKRREESMRFAVSMTLTLPRALISHLLLHSII